MALMKAERSEIRKTLDIDFDLQRPWTLKGSLRLMRRAWRGVAATTIEEISWRV
jgi:hypothetical protein